MCGPIPVKVESASSRNIDTLMEHLRKGVRRRLINACPVLSPKLSIRKRILSFLGMFELGDSEAKSIYVEVYPQLNIKQEGKERVLLIPW